ncbi:uncharacterized protein [Nicotiana tomentosiformis]|uniref:uncharacterized protein n=1 Tax=Nicotiana tomentosiformis TaxID=4098 RepID=UPI00388C91B4
MFLREYVPQSLMDAWHAEFEQLRQGAMTVLEYAIRFSDLVRHAPALVATVRERVHQRLEGILARDREEREAKRSRESGTYSSTRALVAVRHGRGYGSRPIHLALPAASGILVPARPQEPYYALPVTSVPPARDAFSGQSSRPGPSQSQQSRPLRACFECGDTLHMVRDCPRLRRGAPLQTSQA